MFWRLICEECSEEREAADGEGRFDGRFVVHRHCDDGGPHLDVRLEQDGFLAGWRADGDSLDGVSWATEKGRHSVRWLDEDCGGGGGFGVVREDAGVYRWLERGAAGGVLVLEGQRARLRLRVERELGLPLSAVRLVCEALAECGAGAEEAGSLVADGVAARGRAVARLCGLGHELDGDAFDEVVWRRMARDLSLDEIHAQLRGFEVRFDRRYPPGPVSRPERLEDESLDARADKVLSIVRE